MVKIKTIVTSVMFVLCGTFLSTSAYDQALTSRHLIWCIGTIVLVACSKSARLNWFAIGYLGFVLLSGIFAVNVSEWVYASCRAILFVTYISVVDIDKKLLAKTMVCLGIVFTGYFWWDYLVNDSVRGLMRMKNFWAAAHFFVIPFCYYAITKGFWKKLSIAVTSSMIVNICIINSRSAILALMVSVVIVALYNKKLRQYILIGALCTILLIVVCHTTVFGAGSFKLRVTQWQCTAKLIQDNIFGVGAGNYMVVFPKYGAGIRYPGAFVREHFRHPHNDYLWVLSETGIGGLLCYLGMIILALYCAIRKKMAWIVIGLSGYMTIAFFSASHERVFASLMLATLIAIAFKGTKIGRIQFVIPVLLFVLVVFECRYRASCFNKKLRSSHNQWQEVLDYTKGYGAFSTLTFTGIPYHWWKGIANLKAGKVALASEHFETAYKYNPYNVHVINGYGISKAVNGDIEGARQQFEYALEICPGFEDAKKNLRKLE